MLVKSPRFLVRVCVCVCVCIPTYKFLNQYIDFHEICYERYAIGENLSSVIFNSIQSVTVTWRMYEIVR